MSLYDPPRSPCRFKLWNEGGVPDVTRRRRGRETMPRGSQGQAGSSSCQGVLQAGRCRSAMHQSRSQRRRGKMVHDGPGQGTCPGGGPGQDLSAPRLGCPARPMHPL